VVPLIDMYQRALDELKRLIAAGDAAGIERIIERAKREREKLNDPVAVAT
jgi:prephenate dehydrogenase